MRMVVINYSARTDAERLEVKQAPACFVTLCPELAQCNIAGCSSSPNKLTGAKHKNVRQNKQHNTLLWRAASHIVAQHIVWVTNREGWARPTPLCETHILVAELWCIPIE